MYFRLIRFDRIEDLAIVNSIAFLFCILLCIIINGFAFGFLHIDFDFSMYYILTHEIEWKRRN